MRPCRVREALGAALALASSEGLEQCQKQSRSMFRFWSRHDRVPSHDYRAIIARPLPTVTVRRRRNPLFIGHIGSC